MHEFINCTASLKLHCFHSSTVYHSELRMEEYANEVMLLRKQFKATPAEDLEAKRVKFQELADCLTTHYPQKKCSPKSVSTAVKLAFPGSFLRRVGKSKLSYYYGIEESSDPTPVAPQASSSQQQSPQAPSSQQQSPGQASSIIQLQSPQASSSQHQSSDSEEQLRIMNSQLTEKIKELECRIRQLEHAQSAVSRNILLTELDTLTRPNERLSSKSK